MKKLIIIAAALAAVTGSAIVASQATALPVPQGDGKTLCVPNLTC